MKLYGILFEGQGSGSFEEIQGKLDSAYLDPLIKELESSKQALKVMDEEIAKMEQLLPKAGSKMSPEGWQLYKQIMEPAVNAIDRVTDEVYAAAEQAENIDSVEGFKQKFGVVKGLRPAVNGIWPATQLWWKKMSEGGIVPSKEFLEGILNHYRSRQRTLMGSIRDLETHIGDMQKAVER